MKNKVLTVLIGVTITLSMVLGILAGCTPAIPKPTTPTAKTTAPTTTAPGATKPTGTTAAPGPTKAGEVIKWRCQRRHRQRWGPAVLDSKGAL